MRKVRRTVSHLGIWPEIIDGGDKFFKISLQQIDSGGTPSGTIVTSGSFKPNDLDDGKFNWIAVSSATVIAGTIYAIVIEFDDVHPPNPVEGIEVAYARRDFNRHENPYVRLGTGAQWNVNVSTQDYPFSAAVRFTGTQQPLAFGNPITKVFPINDAIPANRLVTASVGERVAMRFKLPAGLATSFKMAGIRIWASAIAADGTGTKVKMGLWKHPDILLQEKEIYPGGTWVWGYWELYFGGSSGSGLSGGSSSSSSCPVTPATLNYDTVYYVGFEQITQNPPTAELPAGLDVLTVREFDSATYPYYDLDAFPGGREVFAAKYEEVASVWQWTEFQDRRPMIDLVLSDITGT
jgi:hypothetical protein